MPEIYDIKERIDELSRVLDRIAADHNQLCEAMITAGVAAGAYPGLVELEHVRTKAETIRSELAALKTRSKLDPQVRQLEGELDQVLARYYWLWQKCQAKLPG